MPRMATATDVASIACVLCGETKTTKPTAGNDLRLPRSWKRSVDGQPICQRCWKIRYLLRAAECSVASVLDAEWAELWAALKQCWSASTSAANAAILALLKAETHRKTSDTKIAPPPQVYLYGEIPPADCGMDPASHVCLMHAVEQRYRKRRYSVLWAQNERPPLYQYPVPYPINKGAWKAETGSGGEPIVKARFSGRWWTLRLRAGKEFRRQLTQHRQIVAGDAIGVEASIRPGSGKGSLILKLVAWFPRQPARKRSGVLTVTTGGDSLLVATVPWKDPWRLNADKARQWVTLHERFRQRMAEDFKHEKRWPKEVRDRFLTDIRAKCDKQNNRLKSFCHEAAAALAGYADRQNVSDVEYDDTDKSYLEKFPWHDLREKLSHKLDALGITLRIRERQGDAAIPLDARIIER